MAETDEIRIIMDELTQYASGSARKAGLWITGDTIQIYVRLGYRLIIAQPLWCLTVANVNVIEHERSKGKYRRLVDHMLTLPTIQGVYFENVLNERLVDFHRRQGCIALPTIPISFYKDIRRTECYAY